MKIIILGAGRVGQSVAESLVSEQNDITVVDTDPQRLVVLQDQLDLRGVAGNAIQPSVLREAGADDADMLISCAPQDETNLVACKVAHDVFHIPTTIARLRSPEFVDGSELLGDGGFAVDRVICPEQSVTAYIRKLVEYPQALQVLEFARGLVSLIAVRAVHGNFKRRRKARRPGRDLPGWDICGSKIVAAVPIRTASPLPPRLLWP